MPDSNWLLEEYRQCSEDHRHYTTLTWQVPSAILLVDFVVIGFLFSENSVIASQMRGVILFVPVIFNVILTWSFLKYVYRSDCRIERMKEIEKDHDEVRRFKEKECLLMKFPLGYLMGVFLLVVTAVILVVALRLLI